MINHDLEKMIWKDILNILYAFILAFILSEVILDLYNNISASSTNLSSSSSDNKNIPIWAIIHTRKTTCYLIPQQILSQFGKNLDIYFNNYWYNWPKEFQRFAQINPSIFNTLVKYLEPQEVFYNTSSNRQK